MATVTAAAGHIFPPSIIGSAAFNPLTAQATEPQGLDRPFFTQAKNRPEVIAHRGGEGHWPGETMYAFERAVKMGVDVLELDVHMTSDDQLVLMHNASVDDTTNGSGEIRKKSWEYLNTLDAGYDWKRGEDFPYRGKGIKIPRLEEVFDAFPQMRMNIEIKQSQPSLVPAFCQLIQKHKMKDNLLVASFSDAVVKEFRSQCHGVATSTAKFELAEFLLKYPLSGGTFKPRKADVIQMKDKLSVIRFINKDFVDKVHKMHLPVHAWTINEPDQMRKMIAAGVDGIITDYPGTLLTLLGRAPQAGISALREREMGVT